ncbi:zinc ABC transporter substrate-binding protein [Pelagibaculum spongiae]|uniref:Zinc ABC transporter substrate-binding protein n=2 Tax=Pelagibaculum spongiae TaxID=2080658 RepID=A0A2V1H0N1_9GAMM|nr:zinc ABC transporter substrate-binding protein [Pelagibaculum spongiae]
MSQLLLVLAFFVVALPASAKLNAFACEPEWAELVREIGGDKYRVFSATNAFQNPHFIEARPSLIAKVRRADLLVCSGAELEIGWLPLLLRQSANPNIQTDKPGYFMAAMQVSRLEIPQHLDRSHGDIHADGNPHVHLDPLRLISIAKKLSQRMAAIDPDNSAYYSLRFKLFRRQLNKQLNQLAPLIAQLEGQKVVVYHKSWSYLLDWLDMTAVADLEPVPGVAPSSSYLVKLLKQIRQQKPAFIMVAAYQDQKAAKWLAKKSGLPLVVLPYTIGGNDSSNNLVELFADTLEQMVQQGLN